MGSLVGGWDINAPGLPPREYADYDEKCGDDGYFAKYERKKSQRRTSNPAEISDDLERLPVSPTAEFQSLPSRRLGSGSLSRSSLPTPTGSGSQAGSLGRSSLTLGAAPAPGGLTRALSLGREGSKTMRGPGLSEAILKGEVVVEPGSPLKRQGSLDAYRSPTSKSVKDQYKWWNKMSSSVLNESADEASADDGSNAPYQPQFHLTGQVMNYRTDGAAPGGVTGGAPAADVAAAHPVQASA